MKIATRLVTAALLACVISSVALGKEASVCQMKQYAEVPLQFESGKLVTFPMTIDGHPITAYLALQSALSQAFPKMLKELDLKSVPVPVSLAENLGKGAKYVQLANVSVGPVSFQSMQMLVSPYDFGGHAAIGLDFFAKLDVELDFPHHVMRLFSPEHCPNAVVYWAPAFDILPFERDPAGAIHFPMELEGRKLDATLGTATLTTTLDTSTSKAVYGFDEKSEGVSVGPNGAGGEVSYFRAMELTASGLSIMNAKVLLRKIPRGCTVSKGIKAPTKYSGCYNNVPLNLGMDVLARMRLYVSMKEKKIYYTVEAVPTADTPIVPRS